MAVICPIPQSVRSAVWLDSCVTEANSWLNNIHVQRSERYPRREWLQGEKRGSSSKAEQRRKGEGNGEISDVGSSCATKGHVHVGAQRRLRSWGSSQPQDEDIDKGSYYERSSEVWVKVPLYVGSGQVVNNTHLPAQKKERNIRQHCGAGHSNAPSQLVFARTQRSQPANSPLEKGKEAKG